MSKAIIWQFNDFIQSRKKKLVKILISEIIFLKARIKRAKNKDELYFPKNALDKLEFILNKLKKYSHEISEEDFDKIISLIYRIFKEIANNLE